MNTGFVRRGSANSFSSPRFLAWRLPYGHTFGMKTAVSIPDEVFEGAERLARRTKKSRSRLFSDALQEYLARHTPEEVTEAMNKAAAQIGETSDPFVASVTRRVLERCEWWSQGEIWWADLPAPSGSGFFFSSSWTVNCKLSTVDFFLRLTRFAIVIKDPDR
jgi:predicted transcriptional regulator